MVCWLREHEKTKTTTEESVWTLLRQFFGELEVYFRRRKQTHVCLERLKHLILVCFVVIIIVILSFCVIYLSLHETQFGVTGPLSRWPTQSSATFSGNRSMQQIWKCPDSPATETLLVWGEKKISIYTVAYISSSTTSTTSCSSTQPVKHSRHIIKGTRLRLQCSFLRIT